MRFLAHLRFYLHANLAHRNVSHNSALWLSTQRGKKKKKNLKTVTKQLIFDSTRQLSNCNITLNRFKVCKYVGYDLAPLVIGGERPEIKSHILNVDYTLSKLSVQEKEHLKVEANYKIDCPQLEKFILSKVYLKLNVFEEIYFSMYLRKARNIEWIIATLIGLLTLIAVL